MGSQPGSEVRRASVLGTELFLGALRRHESYEAIKIPPLRHFRTGRRYSWQQVRVVACSLEVGFGLIFEFLLIAKGPRFSRLWLNVD